MLDLDTEQGISTRLSVSPTNITVNGFDVSIQTWANSKVYGVGITWVAYAE